MKNDISNLISDDILLQDLGYIAKNILKHQNLYNETVLISGATGLIGSLIIKSIITYNYIFDKDVKIIGLARTKEKAKKVFGKIYENPNMKIIYSDITELEISNVKIDYIIHTASPTDSSFFITYPVETIETSMFGTSNILKLAQKYSIKSMVYLSSMEMYGITKNGNKKVTEEDLGYLDLSDVRSSYPAGKRISECLCIAYSKEYSIPVKIARLAQTFGPGVMKSDNRVYAQFAKSVIENRDIVLHTEGNSMGNYCYTRDAIMAILLLLFKGENGEFYNICNEESTIKIRDMAELVSNVVSKGEISVTFDIPKDEMSYGYAPDVPLKLSSEKIRALGWRAEVDLVESYKRLIKSMKQKN